MGNAEEALICKAFLQMKSETNSSNTFLVPIDLVVVFQVENG